MPDIPGRIFFLHRLADVEANPLDQLSCMASASTVM